MLAGEGYTFPAVAWAESGGRIPNQRSVFFKNMILLAAFWEETKSESYFSAKFKLRMEEIGRFFIVLKW